MGFKSLFGRNDSPNIVGDLSSEGPKPLVSRFYLEFDQLEGAPTFELQDSLSVGSEEGDVILDYEGISPKHCTVILNQDILSIIDHGSSEGTFVNKKRIPSGRMIILDLKDKLKLGSIPFRVVVREEYQESPELIEDETVEQTPSELSEPLMAVEETVVPRMNETSEVSEAPETPEVPVAPEAPLESQADSSPLANEDKTQDIEVPTQELGLELAVKEPVEDSEPETEQPQDQELDQKVVEDDVVNEDLIESEEDQVKKTNKTPFFKSLFKRKTEPKKRTKIAMSGGASVDASNGFLRVMAFVFDVLIIGIIYSIFSSFSDFVDIVQALPKWISSMFEPIFNEFILPQVAVAYEALPAIEQMVEALASLYKDEYFFYIEFLTLVAIWRFVTPILFGQTIGQFFIGIRGEGGFLKKRILSIVRSFFGILFLPLFWLFDFPTLFSKRSLKEVLSGTRLYTPSSLLAIISLVVFTPLLVCLFFMSPLLRGLSFPEPVEFKSLSSVKLANYDRGERPVESSYYKISLPMENLQYVLPGFKFIQKNGKSKLEPSLTLVDNSEKAARLSLLKEVNLGDLFADFVHSNPLASINYPGISQMVNDVSNTNKSFKSRTFPHELISEEVQKLVKVSLSIGDLNIDKIKNNLLESGPFLGSYLDFKDKLISLFETLPSQFEFRQVGNAFHIVGIYTNGAMERVKLLPLNSKRTRLYQLSYPSSEKVAIYDLFGYNIRPEGVSKNPFLGFIDLLSSKELKENEELALEIFQSVYGRYYELSKRYLETEDEDLFRRIKSSTSGGLQILTENSKALGLPELVANKLAQNLTDLVKALDGKDLNYFGINAVGAI